MTCDDLILQNSVFGTFNVDEFKRILKAEPYRFAFATLKIDQHFVQHIESNVTLDKRIPKLRSLEALNEPVLTVEVEGADAPLLLIDGHINVIRRYQIGLETIDVWALPKEDV